MEELSDKRRRLKRQTRSPSVFSGSGSGSGIRRKVNEPHRPASVNACEDGLDQLINLYDVLSARQTDATFAPLTKERGERMIKEMEELQFMWQVKKRGRIAVGSFYYL